MSRNAYSGRRRPSRAAGFTLIEVGVALFILILVLGSILVPLTTQVEQRQVSETQRTLEEIREALLGFAVAYAYLPCPDKTTAAGAGTANDGQEDVSGGTCVTNEGNLPWVTLGLGRSDVWGNRFRYRVSSVFAQRAPAAMFSFSTMSSLEVCAASPCTAVNRLTNTGDGPVAIILSHGRNGYGAINVLTSAQNPTPVPPNSSVDERENWDANVTFVSRTHTALGSAAGLFDDILTWLPRSVLLNRMVTAGKLP